MTALREVGAEEVRFDEEQAAIANEIIDIDRQLDELDEHTRQTVEWGLHGSGAGVGALARGRAQNHDDDARSGLQSRRDFLADQLRASVNRPHE